MAVPEYGLNYSDAAVGPKYNATDDLMELAPGQSVFLNSSFWPGTDMVPKATTARYHDDAYTPLRTTIGVNLAIGGAAATFAAAIFKTGQVVNCQGETMLLGVSTWREV